MKWNTRRHIIKSGFAMICACLFDGSLLAMRRADVFVCPPCGCAMDDAEFDAPGQCPACGMTLALKLASGKDSKMDDSLPLTQVTMDYRANSLINRTDIQYLNGEVQIAATLLRPRKGPIRCSAVLIHGSGVSTRNNVWAGMIAQLLAVNGVAVVFPDKRASGESLGDFRSSDIFDLADDALAGVRHIRAHPELDAPVGQIGLIGLSQGGRVAPIVASRYPGEIAFVVNISGGVQTGIELLRHERPNTYREQGVSGAWLKRFMECDSIVDRLILGEQVWNDYLNCAKQFSQGPYSSLAAQVYPTDPDDWRFTWFSKLARFDPEPFWREVSQPTFIAYGANDEYENVPVATSVNRLRRMSKETGKRNFEIHVYDGTGHALWEAGASATRFDEAFVTDLSSWIQRLNE